MLKTKKEIELEIRVKALEKTVVELIGIVQDKYVQGLPDLNAYKMELFNEMNAKYPEMKIEYPG